MTENAGRPGESWGAEGAVDGGRCGEQPDTSSDGIHGATDAVSGTVPGAGHGTADATPGADAEVKPGAADAAMGPVRPTGSARRDGGPQASALPNDRTSTGYRLRPTVGLRMVGAGCVWLCVPLLLEILRRAVPATDVAALAIVRWIGLLLFVVVTVAGAALLLDRRPRLVLSADGFCNRTSVRGHGRRTARWEQVSSVETLQTSAGPMLRITLADGGVSHVSGRVVDADLDKIELDIHQRLNVAHGYRPLS